MRPEQIAEMVFYGGVSILNSLSYLLMSPCIESIGIKAERRNFILSFLPIMVLMVICVACSDSPVEEDNQDEEAPDLEKIVKDMVLIPAGEFLMGSTDDKGLSNEHPQHRVHLDAYYIDQYEVTNAQFKEFVDATGYVTEAELRGWTYVRYPGGWEEHIRQANWRFSEGPKSDVRTKLGHPVVQVSWNDAKAYADWAGKRLPTEAEWEKAARGTDGRRWPWGNVFALEIDGVIVHANFNTKGTMLVGQLPTGVSTYGVHNMAGNVREWVADWYANDYEHSPQMNPKGPDRGEFRILRGGSWFNRGSNNLRCALRMPANSEYSNNFIGFRCAWDFTLSNGR